MRQHTNPQIATKPQFGSPNWPKLNQTKAKENQKIKNERLINNFSATQKLIKLFMLKSR